MYLDSEKYLVTADGPNGIGKGGILSNTRIFLEGFSFFNYAMYDDMPFRTASITEPPQLPLHYYASSPHSRNKDGSILTWRQVLKEGMGSEILKIGSPDSKTRSLAFADGFFTSRAIIERYMFENFPWTYDCKLNPFISMLPNIFEKIPGGDTWEGIPFSKILVKDRGSASTAVFQGGELSVRNLMLELYRAGDLMMEDLTVLLVPTNRERWIKTLKSRVDDIDIHDGKYENQLDNYLNLRRSWSNTFSSNMVYIENDPSGQTNDILEPSLLFALLVLSLKQNGKLNWYDINNEINSIHISLQGCFNLLTRTPFREHGEKINHVISSTPTYFFEGLPLLAFSGDIGLVDAPIYQSKYGIVLAENLSKRVYMIK